MSSCPNSLSLAFLSSVSEYDKTFSRMLFFLPISSSAATLSLSLHHAPIVNGNPYIRPEFLPEVNFE